MFCWWSFGAKILRFPHPKVWKILAYNLHSPCRSYSLERFIMRRWPTCFHTPYGSKGRMMDRRVMGAECIISGGSTPWQPLSPSKSPSDKQPQNTMTRIGEGSISNAIKWALVLFTGVAAIDANSLCCHNRRYELCIFSMRWRCLKSFQEWSTFS